MFDVLRQKYPRAQVWTFGDSPSMANELAALVIKGRKTATCCALEGLSNDERPKVGDTSIVLDGVGQPVCVIRTPALHTVSFDQVTVELAYKEGEGNRSLVYWQHAHQAFFERERCFSPQMPLLFEEFECIEVV